MQKTIKVVNVLFEQKNKTDLVTLFHTNLDGTTGRPGQLDKITNMVINLDAESITTLQTAQTGSVLNIDLTKDGNYWNLTKARVGDANNPIGEKKSSGSGGGGKSSKPYDDVGVKVGASRNQAIAYLSATKGSAFTLDDVDALSYEIIKRQAAQEAAVRSGSITAPPAVATPAPLVSAPVPLPPGPAPVATDPNVPNW